MTSDKFNLNIKKKEDALKKIKDSNYPIIPNMVERHRERVSKATDYLNELKLLYLSTDKEVFVVSKSTFEKRLDMADFATIESDGLYHTIALVSSFPANDCYLVWLESLSNL